MVMATWIIVHLQSSDKLGGLTQSITNFDKTCGKGLRMARDAMLMASLERLALK
jgi:hypothetical protein